MGNISEKYNFDICVVGGGLAGMCAAISAARRGAKTALVHDRPVLGGNASSEIRMWPLDAHGSNTRETGIFEEIVLQNMYLNPDRIYPLWDAVLFDAVKGQENLTCFLNCSVRDAEIGDNRIVSVTGWQLTTYKNITVSAGIFIDCSGDSILSELSGAQYRMGREGADEFGENVAPEIADNKTMGNSCLLQASDTGHRVEFKAPRFAEPITEDGFNNRGHRPDEDNQNFWWMELGGEENTIADAEEIRDRLVALEFGVWNHIKNGGDHGAENWQLDFAGFLPGKRESRRYVGGHILTQNEILSDKQFPDVIAYGGWTIDDHHPAGLRFAGKPTHFYKTPSPFGIPYGCLYSANIENLMFAGRNISVTHVAMAASRVMATCAILGQAAGTAAAYANRYGISPEAVNRSPHIKAVQQWLMEDDCWLPNHKRDISDVCLTAELCAVGEDIENLRNGLDRPEKGDDNGAYAQVGSDITYTLKAPQTVDSVRIVFDSDLDRKTVEGGIPCARSHPTICNRPLGMTPFTFPKTLVRDFDVIVDGETVLSVRENCKRLVTVKIGKEAQKIILRPISTYGTEKAHIFSFDFK